MYFDAVLRSFKKWSTSKNLIYWSNSWQLNPWQWSFTFWTARVRWWCGLFKEIILVFICTSSILIIICKCQWHGSYKICSHYNLFIYFNFTICENFIHKNPIDNWFIIIIIHSFTSVINPYKHGLDDIIEVVMTLTLLI